MCTLVCYCHVYTGIILSRVHWVVTVLCTLSMCTLGCYCHLYTGLLLSFVHWVVTVICTLGCYCLVYTGSLLSFVHWIVTVLCTLPVCTLACYCHVYTGLLLSCVHCIASNEIRTDDQNVSNSTPHATQTLYDAGDGRRRRSSELPVAISGDCLF
jgi:hypothetical protein